MKKRRDYQYILCEIFEAPLENSRHKIRAKPLAGQWAGSEYRIECPLSIRNDEQRGRILSLRREIQGRLRGATAVYVIPLAAGQSLGTGGVCLSIR
jgi:hypothetical protein